MALSEVKESIPKNIEQKKYEFSDYLKDGIDRNEFPRNSGLGKFLRTFRYYQEIKQVSNKNEIPLDHFFWLKMIEGEGDPTNINTYDGWAGISQIQPDTFKQFWKDHLKKNYKIFSDDPKYKEFNYDTLMKYNNDNRKKVNSIIAKELVKIRTENNYDFKKLTTLDDRFNPTIALDFSAEYLKYCKSKINTKDISSEPLKSQLTKYKGFDSWWLLALNGYNKWPNNYDDNVYDFERDIDKKRWSAHPDEKNPNKNYKDHHLNNLTLRIEQYREYSRRMEEWIVQWLSWDKLMDKFREKMWIKIEEKEEEKNKIDNLEYVNISKDGKRNIYKYTINKWLTYPINSSSDIINTMQLYHKFEWKIIELTDKNWEAFNAINAPYNEWDEVYIREKIWTNIKEKEKEKEKEDLEYLNISKDGKRNIYKYTINKWLTYPINSSSDIINAMKLYHNFKWKIIEITDENWESFNPTNIPYKEWDVLYIREKIVE